MQIRVNNGDILLFEVDSKGDAAGDSVAWAPLITYLDSGAIAVTTPDGPLVFGEQDCGAGPTASRRVVIENTGATTLSFTGDEIPLTGPAAQQFKIVSDTGESSLAQGETRTVRVVFDPNTPGAKSASLKIETDDAIEPVVYVPASGTGTGESTSAGIWLEY